MCDGTSVVFDLGSAPEARRGLSWNATVQRFNMSKHKTSVGKNASTPVLRTGVALNPLKWCTEIVSQKETGSNVRIGRTLDGSSR